MLVTMTCRFSGIWIHPLASNKWWCDEWCKDCENGEIKQNIQDLCIKFHETNTSPKFNSDFAPENWWLEDVCLSYWVSVTFQGRTVKLREGNMYIILSGWCSTPNQLLICSSSSRKNGNPLLICSSLSTNQLHYYTQIEHQFLGPKQNPRKIWPNYNNSPTSISLK